MERGLLYTLSGIALTAVFTSCGSKDTVLSPLANGAAGSVAAVGNAATNIAGDTAAQLAGETGSTSTPSKPSSTEPFALREGEQLVDHMVVKGDTLSGLSGRYGTRVSRIQAANNMTGTMIQVGKTIKVPTSNAVAAAPAVPDSAPVPPQSAPATPSGFAGSFSAPESTPAPAAVSPVPAPSAEAPAAPVPSGGLPSFNIGSGLQIQD